MCQFACSIYHDLVSIKISHKEHLSDSRFILNIQ